MEDKQTGTKCAACGARVGMIYCRGRSCLIDAKMERVGDDITIHVHNCVPAPAHAPAPAPAPGPGASGYACNSNDTRYPPKRRYRR